MGKCKMRSAKIVQKKTPKKWLKRNETAKNAECAKKWKWSANHIHGLRTKRRLSPVEYRGFLYVRPSALPCPLLASCKKKAKTYKRKNLVSYIFLYLKNLVTCWSEFEEEEFLCSAGGIPLFALSLLSHFRFRINPLEKTIPVTQH